MRTRLLQLLTHWLSQLTGTSTHKPAPTKPSQAPTPPATKAALYDLQTDDLQTEIRLARKFSLAEAIGREGGSFMKGESAIPRPLRAATELNR
ncbi:MAG: hypothetical protein WA984_01660, partial [Phormidesmis sp.]